MHFFQINNSFNSNATTNCHWRNYRKALQSLIIYDFLQCNDTFSFYSFDMVNLKRLRTCHQYIDHEGLTQQSLLINTPKYHKRYILPGTSFGFYISPFFYPQHCLQHFSPSLIYNCIYIYFSQIEEIIPLDVLLYQLGRRWMVLTALNQSTKGASWMMKMTGINLGLVRCYFNYITNVVLHFVLVLS